MPRPRADRGWQRSGVERLGTGTATAAILPRLALRVGPGLTAKPLIRPAHALQWARGTRDPRRRTAPLPRTRLRNVPPPRGTPSTSCACIPSGLDQPPRHFGGLAGREDAESWKRPIHEPAPVTIATAPSKVLIPMLVLMRLEPISQPVEKNVGVKIEHPSEHPSSRCPP